MCTGNVTAMPFRLWDGFSAKVIFCPEGRARREDRECPKLKKEALSSREYECAQ